MMLCVDILIHLTLWATTVQAFYPWFPTYICDEDGVCENQKRTLPGASVEDAEPAELITFKLSQRFSSKNAASSLNAAREADRLRRKHALLEDSRRLSNLEKLGKRENTYSVLTAATPSETDSVGLNQDGTDFSYFIEAKLGSTGKSLYLLCDTGAGTSWVMGSDCDSTACGMHTVYGSSDSDTYKATGDGFSISYGSGSVTGTLVQDSISMASLKTTMTFGVANTTSDDFTHFAFDGILGLSRNTGATDNFIDRVKTNQLLKSNVFSVDMNRAADGPNTGSISFGGTNPDKYTGSISYTPVSASASGDWAIPMDDMGYDGKKAGISGRLGYIDTGTTYVFGPPSDVAALHKLIPGASSTDGTTFTAPCNSDLPITIDFSGVSHEISTNDWLSAPSAAGVCTSNIYGMEIVSDAWLLGDLFLKNVYAVFDADQSRIGFASKPSASISSSTQAASSTSKTNSPTTTNGQGSTLATTVTPQPTLNSGSTNMPGLSGHETSAGTAASETASASATASATITSSPGDQIESNRYASILCVVAVIIFAA